MKESYKSRERPLECAENRKKHLFYSGGAHKKLHESFSHEQTRQALKLCCFLPRSSLKPSHSVLHFAQWRCVYEGETFFVHTSSAFHYARQSNMQDFCESLRNMENIKIGEIARGNCVCSLELSQWTQFWDGMERKAIVGWFQQKLQQLGKMPAMESKALPSITEDDGSLDNEGLLLGWMSDIWWENPPKSLV